MGRPRKYDSPEEMQKAIDEYFEWAEVNERPLNVARLAIWLGFTGRQGLWNYNGYSEEFFDTIKKATSEIEADKVENMLMGKTNVTASIFDLKNNHDYKDTKDLTGDHNLNIKATIEYIDNNGS